MLATERLIIMLVTRPGEGENHASAGERGVAGGGIVDVKMKRKITHPTAKRFRNNYYEHNNDLNRRRVFGTRSKCLTLFYRLRSPEKTAASTCPASWLAG